jgi:hypothetical protein
MKTKLSQILLPEGFVITHLSLGNMVAQKDSLTMRAWRWEGGRLIERHGNPPNLTEDFDCNIDATIEIAKRVGGEIILDF